MKLVPRAVSKWYPAFAGYFWVPCPACGVEFGGHERSGWSGPGEHFSSIPVAGDPTTFRGICRACTAAGVGCRAHAAIERYHLGCRFVAVPDVGGGS